MNKILLISQFCRGFGAICFVMISVISGWVMAGLFYIAIFLIVSERVLAIELSEDVQVHGFLTQGYFLTSDNNIFGTSDSEGSFDFTEAGLNASWAPNTDLRLAGQVLFRRAGVGHQNDVELDFGVVDYTAFSTNDYRIGVSFGRFKIPFGLYNDTRDVIFTRPTILLPQSIYQERTRDLAISADGGIFYGEYRNDWGDMFLELGAGIPRGASLDSEVAILGFDYPGNTTSKMSYIGRLSYDIDGGKYRMAISSAYVDTRYNPKFLPPDDLPALKDIFTPVIFSVQYNREKLSITAEYAIRGIQETVNDGASNLDISGESYYLQALYRLNQNWQAVVRYDVLYNNRDDKDGWKYQSLTGRPNYTQFAKDWTFGVRYYLDPSFLIAAEYHYVNGVAWLPLQDNPDPGNWEQRWHMFSMAVGYQF